MNILKREISKQFIKFCLIGLETTILYYLIFIFLFYFFGIYYLVSAGFAILIGISAGFFFNRAITFNYKSQSFNNSINYFLVCLFSMGFTIIALKFLVDFMNIYPLISTVILIPITTLINFLGIKLLVFKNKKW